MKYLIYALLCYTLSYSQECGSVMVYRMIENHDDGPCSIVSNIKYSDAYYGTYITAISYDVSFINRLDSFVKQCKSSGEKEILVCNERCIGCDEIDCIIVLNGAVKNDTLFFSQQTKQILFSNDNYNYNAYKYNDNDLVKALNPYLASFMFRNFRDERYDYYDYYLQKKCLIAADKVLVGNKTIPSFTRQGCETNPNYKLVNSDTLYFNEDIPVIEYKYASTTDTIVFKDNKLYEIIVDKPERIQINSLTVGSPEAEIKELYPGIISYYYSLKYEEVLHYSEYSLEAEDGEFFVTLLVHDGSISKITLTFKE